MNAFSWLRIAALTGFAIGTLSAAEPAPEPAAPAAPVDDAARKAFLEKAKDQLQDDKTKPAGDPPAADKPADKAGDKPADKPADKAADEPPAQKPIDKNALKLVEKFDELQKQIYATHNRNQIYQHFDHNYELLRLLPEFVYLGKETRDRLAADNKPLAAYFKTNRKTIALLEDLTCTFQQRLGLEGVKISVPRKMTGAPAPEPTKISADIDLSGDGAAAQGPKDVTREMTQNDRYQIAICESHLKRLAMYRARQSFQECERDWQGVLDNMSGLYFFQLMIQRDPRYGITYSASYQFLQTMKHGVVKIPDPAAEAAAAAAEKKAREDKLAERKQAREDKKAH